MVAQVEDDVEEMMYMAKKHAPFSDTWLPVKIYVNQPERRPPPPSQAVPPQPPYMHTYTPSMPFSSYLPSTYYYPPGCNAALAHSAAGSEWASLYEKLKSSTANPAAAASFNGAPPLSQSLQQQRVVVPSAFKEASKGGLYHRSASCRVSMDVLCVLVYGNEHRAKEARGQLPTT